MPWFHHESDEAQAYQEVTNAPHKAALSHELIAAAASYEAAKAYEKHCEENGKPASHAQAKEILAGLAGAFVDRMVETKGLDSFDKQKAKHEGAYSFHSYSILVTNFVVLLSSQEERGVASGARRVLSREQHREETKRCGSCIESNVEHQIDSFSELSGGLVNGPLIPEMTRLGGYTFRRYSKSEDPESDDA
ncbi:hypothetical protein B0H12DRAFT_325588 [Mycena haematopus]|nr:hypothetical protein B0H12DRAFT_325588 [Mycena haematopus]